MKKGNLFKTLCAVLALSILFSRPSFAAEQRKTKLTEAELVKLMDAYERLSKEYPFDLAPDLLYEAALKGMFQALDEYSNYFNKEDAEDFYRELSGRFVGIGIQMEEKDGYPKIVKVFPGSPAEKTQLKVGDVIVAVDGKDVGSLPWKEIVKRIRGEKDTSVKLTFLRNEKKYHATLIRSVITIEPVESEILEGKIGYIRLKEFTLTSASKFKEVLDKMDESQVTKLVVDLRDNPGGVLSAAVSIAKNFVTKGKIVSIRTVNGIESVHESATEKCKYQLVLLVNENSASASEILAGAVKDRKAGTLVGQKTFGKGIVQKLYPLSDGTIFKYTYAEYLTPNGVSIHKIGIEPDVKVEDLKDVEGDEQLKKALELLK